mmetsp:Transcript_57645/g.94645  ORF Transcript_57645/g.94645 Transcript_57645/m.94645 type:complete len:158 (+) Transcript_57645:526-999(+)
MPAQIRCFEYFSPGPVQRVKPSEGPTSHRFTFILILKCNCKADKHQVWGDGAGQMASGPQLFKAKAHLLFYGYHFPQEMENVTSCVLACTIHPSCIRERVSPKCHLKTITHSQCQKVHLRCLLQLQTYCCSLQSLKQCPYGTKSAKKKYLQLHIVHS